VEAALSTLDGAQPIAIVTGGAKRVGRAICDELSRAGCAIVLTYNTSEDKAQRAARDLGGRAVQLDLNNPGEVARVGAALASELPRVDILVHNASVYGPTPLDALTADDAMRHYRVNALAPALLTAALAPKLRASTLPSGGAVIAMCDIHAMGRPRKDFLGYSMSKAALVEMVRTLARDLAPTVRVNGVAPGVVAWPEEGYESDRAAQEAYLKRVPLQRAGTPDDAAGAVRWLALEAGYITGEVIRLDGGRWLA
jgi:pteridine reductase